MPKATANSTSTVSIFDNLSIGEIVDQLGHAKAEAAEIKAREDGLKAALIARGAISAQVAPRSATIAGLFQQLAPCRLDHPGRQVDPERVHAQLTQVGRDPPRPAAHVRDGPPALGAHHVREYRQDRPFLGCFIQQVTGHVRIIISDGVVRRPRIVQPAVRARSRFHDRMLPM